MSKLVLYNLNMQFISVSIILTKYKIYKIGYNWVKLHCVFRDSGSMEKLWGEENIDKRDNCVIQYFPNLKLFGGGSTCDSTDIEPLS